MDRRNRGSSSSATSRVSNTYGNRQTSDNPRTGSGGGASDSLRRRSDAPPKRNNDEDESNNKEGDPADVSFIVGTCSSMCPGNHRTMVAADKFLIDLRFRQNSTLSCT